MSSEVFSAVDYLQKRLTDQYQPELCLVLGSGLGHLAQMVEQPLVIPYADIPGFPEATVATHAGQCVFGRLGGRQVMVMSGRFHYYEGHAMEAVGRYIQVAHLLGVGGLLVTNAAGGVNPDYRPGDFMLISDHIKLFDDSPVRGRHTPETGIAQRFFDMSRVYSPRLREIARTQATKWNITLHEGVYFFMPGPQYETPAEIRAIRILGGDAVGMSTVPEVIVAAGCGMEILGISCITNHAAGVVPHNTLSDSEVNAVAGSVRDKFCGWVTDIVAHWED